MAYIPRKNTSSGSSSTGDKPMRSAARPGKRSERPAFGAARPPFSKAGAPVKKARWVPRTGSASTTSGARTSSAPARASAARPFVGNGVFPTSPFPQKPPYRPNGAARSASTERPSSTRGTYAKKVFGAPTTSTSRPSYPPRPTKPFGNRPIKPFGKPSGKFAPAKPPKTQLATYAPKVATTSWGGVATWYDKHLESADTYHEQVILPNLLRLVDAQKGELILDLASGQGYFTREFAKVGGEVTGLDISTELIAIAQNEKKHAGAHITYAVGNAEDLSQFTDGQFHKVVIVLALQNIEYVQKVCNEAARVVKQGGTFHIVMNHPAFRIPKRSHWGYDEKEQVQYRRVDQYLSESRSAIAMHPGMPDSPETISFHRPLQYYVKALVKAGFALDRFEEWISHKDSDSGPRAKAENRARKEIPLFLYLRGKK